MEIAIALLQRYSFDLGGYTIANLTRAWSEFKPEWVRQAVIESLFQGRYKAVSVNQILHLWERKGEPNCRYSREFERLVCGDVAVIYEDRIYFTPPRTSSRPSSITEIAPFAPSENPTSLVPLSSRSILSSAQVHRDSPKKPEPKRYPNRSATPSGTTSRTNAYPQTLKADYSEVYRSAYENMTLRAESSMFVDKLRSMCSDRLVLPIPAIADDIDKVKVAAKS